MKLLISRIELAVILLSLAMIPVCCASETDDRIEQDRATGKAKIAQFIISNGSLAMKNIPNRYKLPFWALGAGAYKLHDEFQDALLEERKKRFLPEKPVQPLASEIQAIDLEDALMRAEKSSRYQLMQNAVEQGQTTRVFKDDIGRMITVQIVDKKTQKGVGQKTSLADLAKRKKLVYGPGAEKDRVKTPYSFDGIVSVSGNLAAIGDNSFLVSSPSVQINENGQESVFLHTDQPLLMGTELQLEDERLTLQEMPTSTIPKLF